MNIKDLFDKAEGGVLSYDKFKELAGDAKFVDLGEGNYVDKKKYTDELTAKEEQIKTLNSNLGKRDDDLKALNEKLVEAGADSTKVAELTKSIDELNAKYEKESKDFKAQIKAKEYEYAVKEYANSKNFTSNAAKRDFISEMIKQDFKISDGVIMGADEFVTKYSTDNADAFVKEVSTPNPDDVDPAPSAPKPQFVNPTPGPEAPKGEETPFKFSFQGVRLPENK